MSAPDDKSKAVLDAALSLLAERGFHGMTVPAVAEAAGVGIGTVYRRFEDKRQLVNAVYRAQMQALAHVVEVGRRPGTMRSRHRAIFEAIFAWYRANPDAVLFLEMHKHGDYLDDASREAKVRFLADGMRFYEEGIEADVFKALPPMILAIAGWGIAMQLLRAVSLGYATLDAQSMAAVERCAWEAIRA